MVVSNGGSNVITTYDEWMIRFWYSMIRDRFPNRFPVPAVRGAVQGVVTTAQSAEDAGQVMSASTGLAAFSETAAAAQINAEMVEKMNNFSMPEVTRREVIGVCEECGVEKVWSVTEMKTEDSNVARWASKRDSAGSLITVGCVRTNFLEITPLDDNPNTEPPFTITLDTRGGTLTGTSTLTTNQRGGYLSQFPTPTRGDDFFIGWFTHPTEGRYVLGGSNPHTITFTRDTTLYARWADRAPRVTLDVRGGVLAAEQDNPVEVDNRLRLPAITAPTREGHTFVGWFDQAEGGEWVLPQTIGNLFFADGTIYARWVEGAGNRHTITFDYNGGRDANFSEPPWMSSTTRADGRLMQAPNMAMDGNVFVGWFTARTGGEEVILGEGGTVLTRAQTIWARFEVRHYTITFDPRGGSLGEQPTSATTNDRGRLMELPTPERAGYTFDSWWLTNSWGGEERVTTGSTHSFFLNAGTVFNRDTTIYARWTADE
jgi:uncharacterized repeat protein (TIGR02543 family)